MEKEIIKKYTDPLEPGSFSGVSGFIKNHPYLGTEKQVKDTLSGIKSYSDHKKINRKYKQSKILVDDIDDIWQIDLIDVKDLKNKRESQWISYLLVVIDVLSRYAWVQPLRNKEAKEIKDKFIVILNESKRKPKMIYSDKGSEFLGEFSQFLKQKKIVQKFTNSVNKASIAERFNRTLKEKLWRYFTFSKKTNFIKVLKDILVSYNNSIHSSIRAKPSSINSKNDVLVYNNQVEQIYNSVIDFKYKIGDYVRIPVKKGIFDKGYKKNWDEKIYIIKHHIPTVPEKYILYDLETNKILKNQFYRQELNKVPDKEFPFDSFIVIDEDNHNLLVRQINTENETEQWIEKDQFQNDAVQENQTNEIQEQQEESTTSKRFSRNASKKAKQKVYLSVQMDNEAKRIKKST